MTENLRNLEVANRPLDLDRLEEAVTSWYGENDPELLSNPQANLPKRRCNEIVSRLINHALEDISNGMEDHCSLKVVSSGADMVTRYGAGSYFCLEGDSVLTFIEHIRSLSDEGRYQLRRETDLGERTISILERFYEQATDPSMN